MRLIVLDVYKNGDETWLTVCKETAASNPLAGRFGVRAADTSAIDMIAI